MWFFNYFDLIFLFFFWTGRRSGTLGAGNHEQHETRVHRIHLPYPMRGHVEPRIGNRLPDSQDDRVVRTAAVAHVRHLLSDCPSLVEVRQYTRAHGNRTDVQQR